MRKYSIYIFTLLALAIVFTMPNLNFLLADVSSLKQQPTISESTEEAPVTESNPLPSFLESSSGVLETTDIGLTGSTDPTVPLSYTSSLVDKGIQNDIDIYGIEISEEAKAELISQILGNSELDSNLTNNATDNDSDSVSVNIKVVKTLEEFCSM